VPIVAAGGFANGQGLAAALTLGADAVAMGSRFAITRESPLAETTKDAVVKSSESDTLYGSNFDGIPARVLKSPAAQRLMKNRPFFPVVVYRAFQASQTMKIPLWKVLPGLLTQYDKMYMVAQLGAATSAIQAATVDGDMKEGVQFIGQCQGLIDDIESVEEVVQRILREAEEASSRTSSRFEVDSGRIGHRYIAQAE
jgi:enoyl-[acyl-carrier protein] reductase II